MEVKIGSLIKEPQNLIYELKKRKKDIIVWSLLIIIVILVFILISSKDFSFMLVLSSLTQMFSFVIVLLKVYNCQNCSGLSLNTLICYLLVLSGRLSSTLFYNGYLPSDSSGDWFYQLTEILSLLFILLLIFFMKKTYKQTSDTNLDTIKFYYFAIPCLIIGLLVHPVLNSNFITDSLWTFSMYLQAFSIFPQIQLFTNKKGQIETYTSHFVALLGLSTVFSIFFWYDTYEELNNWSDISFPFFADYVGYIVIFSQALQLIIMADFYYLYFKSLLKGEQINTMGI